MGKEHTDHVAKGAAAQQAVEIMGKQGVISEDVKRALNKSGFKVTGVLTEHYPTTEGKAADMVVIEQFNPKTGRHSTTIDAIAAEKAPLADAAIDTALGRKTGRGR